MLTTIDTDWRECMHVDQHLHLVTKRASTAHFCSNALFGFYTFSGVLYYTYNNAIAIVHQTKNNNDTLRPFPVQILLPFEAEQSPVYELLVIGVFLQSMLNVYAVTALDALLFTLVRLGKF